LIRSLIALAAAAFILAAAPAKDWRQTTGVAATGGFTVGNPAAKVKLVEYLSYTCPHCGDFVKESKPVLHDQMVRNGQVQVETRSAARDPYDLAAWILARCGGPQRFASLNAAIFAQQTAWMDKGQAYAQANLPALKAMSQLAQMKTLVKETGLGAIAAGAGLAPAKVDACFATNGEMTKVLAMTDAAFKKVPGTPGFEINGEVAAGVASWDALEPKLRAAGAR
jgi:protein-disulfide isomerase